MSEGLTAPVVAGLAVGAALVVLFSFFTGSDILPLQRNYDDAVITLERTACYGSCPVYSLTIFGNGTVVYDGQRHVAVAGKQISSIPQEEVQRLVNYFHKSGFFSMKNDYGACCDAPKYTTSITIDNISKTVIYNYYSAPLRLADLDKKIDNIAGSDKLARCPEGERVASVNTGGCQKIVR